VSFFIFLINSIVADNKQIIEKKKTKAYADTIKKYEYQPVLYGPLRVSLLRAVCEVYVIRRHKKTGRPIHRRFFCTACPEILNSDNGRNILGFIPPHENRWAYHKKKNLIAVWDIMMQDWRLLNMDECYKTREYPVKGFWEFFNEVILPMGAEEKMSYMDT
jgi:hypothetical protein